MLRRSEGRIEFTLLTVSESSHQDGADILVMSIFEVSCLKTVYLLSNTSTSIVPDPGEVSRAILIVILHLRHHD